MWALQVLICTLAFSVFHISFHSQHVAEKQGQGVTSAQFLPSCFWASINKVKLITDGYQGMSSDSSKGMFWTLSEAFSSHVHVPFPGFCDNPQRGPVLFSTSALIINHLLLSLSTSREYIFMKFDAFARKFVTHYVCTSRSRVQMCNVMSRKLVIIQLPERVLVPWGKGCLFALKC